MTGRTVGGCQRQVDGLKKAVCVCVCVGMWGVAASEITKEKAIKQKLYTQKIDVSR